MRRPRRCCRRRVEITVKQTPLTATLSPTASSDCERRGQAQPEPGCARHEVGDLANRFNETREHALHQHVVAQPARGAVRELAQVKYPASSHSRHAAPRRRGAMYAARGPRDPRRARPGAARRPPSITRELTPHSPSARQRGCEIRLCCDDPSAAPRSALRRHPARTRTPHAY